MCYFMKKNQLQNAGLYLSYSLWKFCVLFYYSFPTKKSKKFSVKKVYANTNKNLWGRSFWIFTFYQTSIVDWYVKTVNFLSRSISCVSIFSKKWNWEPQNRVSCCYQRHILACKRKMAKILFVLVFLLRRRNPFLERKRTK